MKNIKKIILLLLPFLLSGCTLQYNLKINEDLSFEENIIVKEGYGYFDHIKKNPEYARKYILEMMDSYNPDYAYAWEYLEELETYGTKIKRKFNSLEELSQAQSIKFLYDGVGIERNNNKVTIKSIGKINMALVYTYAWLEPSEEDVYNYIVTPKDTYLSITVPYKVIYHSADKVNKETNTYYWLITEKTTDKNIEITFDLNKKHFSLLGMIKSFPYKLLLFPLIIVIIVLLGKKVVEKSRLNNEI